MKHAHLKPSQSERWLHCPGSVRMSEAVPDVPSEAADIGWACHELLARTLRGDDLPEPGAPLRLVDPDAGRTVTVDVSATMLEWVESAARWVRLYLAAVPKTVLRVETKVVPGSFYQAEDDLYGHADVILASDDTLVVVDAKFGRVEVEGSENPQLTLYAIGAAEDYEWRHSTYKLVILQPQSPIPAKVEILTKAQLRDRAKRYAPAVREALQPDARLVPGSYCTFCAAAGACPALQARAQKLARRAFSDVRLVTEEQLSDILASAKEVRAALDRAETYALQRLSRGQTVGDWKRVAGRGLRQWRSEAEAERFIRGLGLDPWKKTLLSPNQVEEAVGAKGGKLTLLAPKRPGNPTLVPGTDKRPALPPDFVPEPGSDDNDER